MIELYQDIRYFELCLPRNFISSCRRKGIHEWLLHETNLQLLFILKIKIHYVTQISYKVYALKILTPGARKLNITNKNTLLA